MAQQSSNELQPLMTKLYDALHDDRDLLHRGELDHIFSILDANKDKITSQRPELEKKDELPKLLRKIDDTLRQCQTRSKQQQPAAKSKKKTMPSVSDCNPFKSRASPLPVEALLRETIAILGDAPPRPPPPHAAAAAADHNAGAVTELYEWTTSYVDETKIYGWSDEADKVVDALVGEGEKSDEVSFRAAGITGIHGSGKTALAQKVFVHDRVKDTFPLRLWVCVGPPDSEDKFCLLYRMLDNLGLDTAKVENIVENASAVEHSTDKEKSKIGVLLFILYVTLYKTGYLIVFDDIRVYKDREPKDGDQTLEPPKDGDQTLEPHKDGESWYSNLPLEPPKEGEWNDRLAYGLPKVRKSAVLVTCRKEDDARAMVRTGRVFQPPKLSVTDGWRLFTETYNAAKKKAKEKEGKEQKESEEKEKEQKEGAMDKLYKVLEEMKENIIDDKCLGLPVAIIEAAKGFAKEDLPEEEAKAAGVDPTATSETEPAQAEAHEPAN